MDSQKLDASNVATAALLLLNDLRSNLKVSLEFLKISWGVCLQTPLTLHAYACIRTHQTTMYLLATGLIMHGKTRSFCALASTFKASRLDCACAL